LVGLDASTKNLLLVYAVILLSHALINHYGIRLVARLNDLSVAVHILGIIVIVGALLLFAPKQPASFFFERVTHNPSGWPYWGGPAASFRRWWAWRCGAAGCRR